MGRPPATPPTVALVSFPVVPWPARRMTSPARASRMTTGTVRTVRHDRARSLPGRHPMSEAIPPEIDQPRIERAVLEILLAIGEDPERDGLVDTPARVARAMAEQFSGLRQRPEDVLTTVFDANHEEMIIVRDIEIYSTCEHHLVPFHGVAHVGYIPNVKGEITGLSKIARLVDLFAKRPQVQERLTAQIADALVEILEPRGVIVVVE